MTETQAFATFTPTTLAAMAADLSQYLAEEFDGPTVSSKEWDALAEHLAAIVAQLDALTEHLAAIVAQLAALDDDYMALLMEAGADPDVIFEGAPA